MEIKVILVQDENDVVKVGNAILTTEHSSSSYGIPVILYEGEVFSPYELPENIKVAVPRKARRKSIVQLAKKFGYNIVVYNG